MLFPTVAPGVDQSDAYSRAAGNDKPLAIMIGNRLFRTLWPAQVLSVYAALAGDVDVVGLRISGKHFHRALTASDLAREVADTATQALAVDPRIEEVDVWVTLPLDLTKDVVVKSDVNTPTWKTVFSISVRRGENAAGVMERIARGDGVYWDQEWRHNVLKMSNRVP